MEMTKEQQSAANIQALAATLEQAQQDQAEALVLDFDAALKEHRERHQPIRVKLLGRVFELPPSVPFRFVVFAQRHCFKVVNGKQVFDASDAPALEMIEHVFGPEMLAALEESDVDVHFVMERVMPDIMQRWGMTEEADGAKKKPE